MLRACEPSAKVRLGVEGEWRTKFVLSYNPVLIVHTGVFLCPDLMHHLMYM